ncbi:type II secretion system protein [bacterium]|nr:type II secretion system protein [bacterium]
MKREFTKNVPSPRGKNSSPEGDTSSSKRGTSFARLRAGSVSESQVRWGASRKGKSNCHSELVSESISKKTLKQVQGDNVCSITLREKVYEGQERGYFATNFGKTPRILRSAGFTLAEVLITLGIIGVVAAMTIPTLMANTNSHKFRSQFKKTLSTLNQAGRMAQAQYDFSYGDLKDKTCTDPATDNPENTMSICAIFNGTLKGLTYLGKYGEVKGKDGNIYSVSDSDGTSYQTSPTNNNYIYALADGSLIIMYTSWYSAFAPGSHIKSGGGIYGWIDVNGLSLPNKMVSCKDATTSEYADYSGTEPCVVSNDPAHLTDVYPIFFQGTNALPNSNAALYVLDTAK